MYIVNKTSLKLSSLRLQFLLENTVIVPSEPLELLFSAKRRIGQLSGVHMYACYILYNRRILMTVT